MRIYTKKELIGFNGNPILTRDEIPGREPAPVAKLGDLVIESLIQATTPSDQGLNIETKERMWNIARRIQKAMEKEEEFGMLEMPIEDISFIRKRVGQTHTTALVGACVEAMNWVPKPAVIKEEA